MQSILKICFSYYENFRVFHSCVWAIDNVMHSLNALRASSWEIWHMPIILVSTTITGLEDMDLETPHYQQQQQQHQEKYWNCKNLWEKDIIWMNKIKLIISNLKLLKKNIQYVQEVLTHFYIVSYYINWAKTSWTDSMRG